MGMHNSADIHVLPTQIKAYDACVCSSHSGMSAFRFSSGLLQYRAEQLFSEQTKLS